MISHGQARRLLKSLEGDQEAVEALSRYIAEQEAPTSIEGETVSQTAERASRRAIEAISRAVTVATDVESLNERIRAVEASLVAYEEVLAEILGKVENR